MSVTELNEIHQPRSGKPSRTSHYVPYIMEETTPHATISGGYSETPSPIDKGGVRRSGSALRRSGSVDEGDVRTMTMSGLRLVVANPD